MNGGDRGLALLRSSIVQWELHECDLTSRGSLMWRRCDLHSHTTPNEVKPEEAFDPTAFVDGCLDLGLDVVAVTDHEHVDRAEAVAEAAKGTALQVLAGVEVATDRGDVLLIAPVEGGVDVLRNLLLIAGAKPGGGQISFEQLLGLVETRTYGDPPKRFKDLVLTIGAHTDKGGSLLGSDQPIDREAQVAGAEKLDAIEVCDAGRLKEWSVTGVKQTGVVLPLIRGSDSHIPDDRIDVATWMYLPEIDVPSFRHAFATWESSLRHDVAEQPPSSVISSVRFEGGPHDGLTFAFCERTNAIIGPPSSGKSLIVDAIRFAFGRECEIPEIADVCNARLRECLKDGGKVVIEGVHDGEDFVLERTWGGGQVPTAPYQPIAFSQTELVRRAFEKHPSMTLLDVHSPDVSSLKKKLDDLAVQLREDLARALELAERARQLSGKVHNAEDGLKATKDSISALIGSEAGAKQAVDLARIRAWRSSAIKDFKSWLETYVAPSGPPVATTPSLESGLSGVDSLVPQLELEALVASFRDAVDNSAKELVIKAEELLGSTAGEVDSLEEKISNELKVDGLEHGQEILTRLGHLKNRLEGLEADAAELLELEADLDEKAAALMAIVDESERARDALRSERKKTCTKVNESMPTFFSRILEDQETQILDEALGTAKVGTGKWSTTLQDVRDRLDRRRLVSAAVRLTQGRPDLLPSDETLGTQDAVAREAVRRENQDVIAAIATRWPGDRLVLALKKDQRPFEEVTEGMRALAIKEISFAATDVPVITDQPEDAVAPQAVFDNLVPTIRRQRSNRQFILASHDANIVVAGDAERVWVLGEDVTSGTLFDPSIRSAAMELLEGGEAAFELRDRRYRTR